MEMQQNLEGQVLKEFGYTKIIVERILAEYPKTRDLFDDEFKRFVHSYCIVYDLETPKSETIRRTRQKIQNTEGKYPPSERIQAIKKAREEAIERNIKYI